MKTEIQRRIENTVTDYRGYLKIPTLRILGNKKALNWWLDFSNYREVVDEIVNDPGKLEELRNDLLFNRWIIDKPNLRNDKISFWEYLTISRGVELKEMVKISSMIPQRDFQEKFSPIIYNKIYNNI